MCIVNSTQQLVEIYNLRQSIAHNSWSKYTTFDEVEVESEKLIFPLLITSKDCYWDGDKLSKNDKKCYICIQITKISLMLRNIAHACRQVHFQLIHKSLILFSARASVTTAWARTWTTPAAKIQPPWISISDHHLPVHHPRHQKNEANFSRQIFIC